MSKKFTAILIIIIILAAIAGLYLYFQKGPVVAPGEELGFQEFNPLGSGVTGAPSEGGTTAAEEGAAGKEIITLGETSESGTISKLAQVSSINAAGFGVFKKIRNKTPEVINKKTKKPETEEIFSIRYAERGSGNIFERVLNGNNTLEIEKRIAIANIPTAYDAYFANNGNNVLIRYAKEDTASATGFTIETFNGIVPADTQYNNFIAGELRGDFLEENITDLSVAPDGENIFYLAGLESGDKTTGIILSLKDNGSTSLTTSKKTVVFESSFTEWLSQFINSKYIGIATKAANQLPTFAYLLNTTTKTYEKILGDINGGTTSFSPDAKKLAYNTSSPELYLYDTGTKSAKSLGVNTLAEKCSWGTNEIIYCAVPKSISGSQPDDWYQGLESFNDSFWKIDTISGTTTVLFDPASDAEAMAAKKDLVGSEIDGVNLKLDENQNYLFFTNKKDGSVWIYKL